MDQKPFFLSNSPPDDNRAWVMCPSRSFPGNFYYHNMVTGESIWNLEEIERQPKFQRRDFPQRQTFQYPEPISPPHISQMPLSYQKTYPQFGQLSFPKYLNDTLPQYPMVPRETVKRVNFDIDNNQLYNQMYRRNVSLPPYVSKQNVMQHSNFEYPKEFKPKECRTQFNFQLPSIPKHFSNENLKQEYKMQDDSNNNHANRIAVQATAKPLSMRFKQFNENPLKRNSEDQLDFLHKKKKSDESLNPEVNMVALKDFIVHTVDMLKSEFLAKVCTKCNDEPKNKPKSIFSPERIDQSETKDENQNEVKKRTRWDSNKVEKEVVKLTKTNSTRTNNTYDKDLELSDLRLRLKAKRNAASESEKKDKLKNFKIPKKEGSQNKKVTFDLKHQDEALSGIDGDSDVNQDVESNETKFPNFENKEEWFIVTDLDCLIEEFSSIKGLIEADSKLILFLPYKVKYALDKMCSGKHEERSRVMKSRQVSRDITKLRNRIIVGDENVSYKNKLVKDPVLISCLNLIEKGDNVVLITDNKLLYKNADLLKVPQNTSNSIKRYLYKLKQKGQFSTNNKIETFFDQHIQQSAKSEKENTSKSISTSNSVSTSASNSVSTPASKSKTKTTRKATPAKPRVTRSNSASKVEQIDTKKKKVRSIVYCPESDRQFDANSTNSETSISKSISKDVVFEAKVDSDLKLLIANNLINDFYVLKKDEWLCSFTQVMEDALTLILVSTNQKHPELLPPWNFIDCLKIIMYIHESKPKINYIGNKLLDLLEKHTVKGTLSNKLRWHELMYLFSYSKSLMEVLAENQYFSTHALECVDALKNLLKNWKDPITDSNAFDLNGKFEFNDTVYEGKSKSEENKSDIIDYVSQHYPKTDENQYMDEHQEFFEDEQKNYNVKIIRTIGKDLPNIRLHSQKSIEVNDVKPVENTYAETDLDNYFPLENFADEFTENSKFIENSNFEKTETSNSKLNDFGDYNTGNTFFDYDSNEASVKIIRKIPKIDKYESETKNQSDDFLCDSTAVVDDVKKNYDVPDNKFTESIPSFDSEENRLQILTDASDDLDRLDYEASPILQKNTKKSSNDFLDQDSRNGFDFDNDTSNFDKECFDLTDFNIDLSKEFDFSMSESSCDSDTEVKVVPKTIAKTFLKQLKKAFLYINKVIVRNAKILERGELETEVKFKLQSDVQVNESQLQMIIYSLKKIKYREEFGVVNMKSVAGNDEDARISRYKQIITKCLEQAEVLRESNMLISDISQGVKPAENISNISNLIYYNIFET